MRSNRTALTALSFGVVAMGAIVWAEVPPPVHPPEVPAKSATAAAAADAAPLDVLRNRPDAPQAAGATGALVAPDLVQFRAAGISIRPIGDSRVFRKYGGDDVAEFVNDSRKWTLKVASVRTKTPMGLNETVDLSGRPVPGIMDVTVDGLKRELPAMKLLRKDTVAHGEGGVPSEDPTLHVPNVGMIAIRYTKGVERLLSQQAIIQSSDTLYYSITLTSPGRKDIVKPGEAPNAQKAAAPAVPAAAAPAPDAPVQAPKAVVETDDGPADPGEKLAVEAFDQVLDSVKLLDRSKLKEDQDQRLFKTRSLFVNLTEKKLTGTMIPEQWFRIIHSSKDVGYIYTVEETSDGIPRSSELQKDDQQREAIRRTGGKPLVGTGEKGILVGSRSRMMSATRQIDSESWMFVAMDRKHEDWSTITVLTDRKSGSKDNIMTLGTSDRQMSRSFDHESLEKGYRGDKYDPNQPPVRMGEEYSLTVNRYAQKETPEPVTKRLPPFYLPQAMGYLLPRLVPLNIPKQYLFATYVPDMSQVMLRYVDVGEEQRLTLAGRSVRAIPVQDKLGLDGSVTTHFMSRDGQYLGSQTKETGITIVPTDEKTLREIWKDANLSRPADVEQAVTAAVSRAGASTPAENPAQATQGPPAPRTAPPTVGPVAPRRLAPRDRSSK